MHNSEKYHFIIGIPRSGTTLLSFILNKNKQVLALHEPKFAAKVIRDKKESNLNSFSNCKSYFSNIKDFHNVKDSPYQIDTKKLAEVWKTPQKNRSVKSISFKIAKAIKFLDKDNIYIDTIFDKNPIYTLRIDDLVEAFPEAKFIVTTRDYRAFALSNMEKRNPTKKIHSYLYLGIKWNFMHKHMLRALDKYANKCLLVKYEDLVSQTKTTVKEICDFCNIEYSDDMLSPEKFNLENRMDIDSFSKRKKTKYKDLSKPINNNREEAWKNKLSSKNIEKLDITCQNIGSKLGYKQTKKPILFKTIFYFILSIPYRLIVLTHKYTANKL